MKLIFTLLMLVNVGLFAYLIGTIEPRTVHEPLMGYHESSCDQIIRIGHGGYCQVQMSTDSEDIRIFRKDM